MKLRCLFTSLLLVLLISCARERYLQEIDRQPGTTAAEHWGVHNAPTEWWYMTGRLNDAAGHTYFFQYTLFHGVRNGFQGLTIHMAITDITNGKEYFEEFIQIPSPRIRNKGTQVIRTKISRLELKERSILLKAEKGGLKFDLSMEILGQEVWHGDEGRVSMGNAGERPQEAYYYSWPDLQVNGTICLPGEEVSKITGQGWFDKQWGDFDPVAWHWFSIRLTTGEMVMIFHFPGQEIPYGTLIDGPSTTALPDLNVRPIRKEAKPGMIDLEWEIIVPGLDLNLTIVPEVTTGYRETRFGLNYWEGLCRVTDAHKGDVGWSITEVTHIN